MGCARGGLIVALPMVHGVPDTRTPPRSCQKSQYNLGSHTHNWGQAGELLGRVALSVTLGVLHQPADKFIQRDSGPRPSGIVCCGLKELMNKSRILGVPLKSVSCPVVPLHHLLGHVSQCIVPAAQQCVHMDIDT